MTGPKSAASIVRKLHGWELLHLREHAASLEAQNEALAAENERLRRELQYAEDCADSWRDDVMRLQEEGMQLGLTKDGHVVALPAESPLLTMLQKPQGIWLRACRQAPGGYKALSGACLTTGERTS